MNINWLEVSQDLLDRSKTLTADASKAAEDGNHGEADILYTASLVAGSIAHALLVGIEKRIQPTPMPIPPATTIAPGIIPSDDKQT